MLGIRRYRGAAIDLFQGEIARFVVDAAVAPTLEGLRSGDSQKARHVGIDLARGSDTPVVDSGGAANHSDVASAGSGGAANHRDAAGRGDAPAPAALMQVVKAFLDSERGQPSVKRITLIAPTAELYKSLQDELFKSFPDEAE